MKKPESGDARKSLIVCYSYSGNTWRVAEEIRRQTGAPLCEIYPKQPYSMSFDPLLTQVRKELELGFCPSLFPIEERVEDYEIIFVGTPNWCGTVAPPMAAFLKKSKLDGRYLLPFYTHCGGSSGNMERNIRSLCPGAIVGEGIGIVNAEGSDFSQKIASWISKIPKNI